MKRSFFSLFCLCWGALTAYSQSATWNKSFQDYFDTYDDVAVEQMKLYGIPASITLAQGVLESGAGRSELARKSNNHFGIKCNNGWSGRRSYHDDDALGECFRAYDNAYDSYVDHSLFLTGSPRYSSLFKLKKTDYKGWARGLKSCGYATSPTYATRLIEIIELYKLYKYDSGKRLDKFQEQQVQRGDLRHVNAFNKNYYVVASHGDTFYSIADDVNISACRLARFNERDVDDPLEEGERIWLKKKRSNAPKEYTGYVYRVKDGESLYSISQHFGIRLKYLYKMNDLNSDYVLKVGDYLRIR